MAEKVEIDIPSIGKVEAKNAASEATLYEILDLLKKWDKKIGSGGGGGGGAGAGGGKGLKSLDKDSKNAGKSIDGIGDAADKAGDRVEELGKRSKSGAQKVGEFTGAVIGLASAMTDMISDFASMGNSLTSAARTFNSIPVVGGVLSGVFGAVAQAAEGQLKAYQDLSSVGATFGGSMSAMTAAASGAGLTVEQFSNIVKGNAETMMLLGGTTEAGAKRFAELSKTMRSSGLNDQLLRMGYSTEQINGGMAGYLNILGKTGALQNMTTQQIAQSSAGYLKDLDALAKITGSTREEKQKEQEALMKDAQVRAAMAGMDADAQKQMMAYITSFPKEQQAAIKDMIATGNITSEEALKLNAMMPGAAAQVMQFGRTLQSGGKISKDQMNNARNAAIMEARQNQIRYREQGLYNKEMGETYVGMSNLAAQKINGVADAYKEGADATKKANPAEELEKSKQRLSEFSNFFTNFLAQSGLVTVMMRGMEALGAFIQAVAVPVFSLFSSALQTLTPAIDGVILPGLYMLGDAVYAVSDFIEDNLTPIMVGLAAGALTLLPALSAMATSAWANVTALGKQAMAAIIASLPFIKIAAPVMLLAWLFKKAGGDLEVLTGGFKWLWSYIEQFGLNIMSVYYTIMDKITPGDKYKKLLEENAEKEKKLIDKRKQLETDMANRMKENREKAAKADEKKSKERHARDMNRMSLREKKEEELDEKREEAIEAQVDMSSPARMAQTFREQQLGKPAAPAAQGKPSAAGIPTGKELGGLSERYEAGNKGSSAVGWDRTGGTSFGKYQIATRTGTMNKFMEHLKKTNPEAFERLSKAGPADSGKNGAFAQEWKKLAGEGKLAESEHDFIKKTHFDVGMSKVKDKGLSDMIGKSKALQEVMWSTSVQHGGGGAGGMFNKVFKEGMSEQDLIKAIYAERGTRFGSSSRGVQQSVQNRFADEQQRALAMVGTPGGTVTPSGTAVAMDVNKAKEEQIAKVESANKPDEGKVKESPAELLATLNSKMDELIKVASATYDINDRQLSVQKDLGENGLMNAQPMGA
jgi:hypothetical protein